MLMVAIVVPYQTLGQPTPSGNEPYEQEFLITAYYSPMPGQCCYVRGGEAADKVLNGQGIAGADLTPVFPGYLPVSKEALAGLQTGQFVYQSVNLIPSEANLSKEGVLKSVAPMHERSPYPWSYVKKTIKFGLLFGIFILYYFGIFDMF